MRFVWMVAVVAGVFLAWMAYRGATRPGGPDRLVATYGIRDGQGRMQYLREDVSGQERAAQLLGVFNAPEEADVGIRRCPLDIRLDFYAGSSRTASFAVGSDGCGTVRLLEGSCASAGRSGYFSVYTDLLDPIVRRHRELTSAASTNRTAEAQVRR